MVKQTEKYKTESESLFTHTLLKTSMHVYAHELFFIYIS